MTNKKKIFLEALDSRTKFFVLVVLGFQTVLLRTSWTLFTTAIIVAIGVIASPITIRMLLRQIRRVFWFSLFITLINTLTVSGTVFFEIWGMYGTLEGLTEGLLLSGRIVLLLLLSYLFVQTTSIPAMLDGVEAMLSPFRRRLGSATVLLSLTINFVPLVVQSAQRIKVAQVARGADVDSSFLKQLRFALAAALPLFVSAFRSSHHLAEALDARCYDAATMRTSFARPTMSSTDWATLFILLLLFIFSTRL